MAYCIVPKIGSGRIRAWERAPDSPFDDATEQRVDVGDRAVDRETEWWDGAAIAPMPQGEQDAEADRRRAGEFDRFKLIKAAVLEILDEIDARHPANVVDRAAFRQNVLARYKAL